MPVLLRPNYNYNIMLFIKFTRKNTQVNTTSLLIKGGNKTKNKSRQRKKQRRSAVIYELHIWAQRHQIKSYASVWL